MENRFINKSLKLQRSQILVVHVHPSRPQRTVGAQFMLDLIFRKIISHLQRELFPNANVYQ